MPSNQQVKENSKGDGDYSMAGHTITATIIQLATNTYIGLGQNLRFKFECSLCVKSCTPCLAVRSSQL